MVILQLIGLVMSLITGILVMSQKKNRKIYPYKFIGIISLAQATQFYQLLIFRNDWCSNYELGMEIFENSMVIEGSAVS